MHKYRADIDGMRAIAVLSVVIYHLHKTWLPGGFLGVDVFFVLSGFLITSIVWREIGEERFSIGQFYERRIRRILPALIVVLTLSTIAALFILLPTDLIGYGKSVIATIIFVANIYFWRDTNYFSPLAEQKPLLHMWSLGIEEQFYIFFPIFLVIIFKYFRSTAFYWILLLTLISLATHILLVYVGGASPAFFLLPSRAWELGAGALLALAPHPKPIKTTYAQLLTTVALAVVIAGLIVPADSLHPLIPAGLFVVASTCTIIFLGISNPTWVRTFLGLRPLVYVGLISYSLYLWHWPILVFARYYLVRELTLMESGAALLLMFALSAASLKYIETPARNKGHSIRNVSLVAGIAALLLSVASIIIVSSQGLPARLSKESARINESVGQHYRCPTAEYVRLGQSRACRMNLESGDIAQAEIILLGNSHAQMYAPIWADIARQDHKNGLLVPLNNCLPITNVNVDPMCFDAAQRNFEAVVGLPNVETVVLAMNWDFRERDLMNPRGERVEGNKSVAMAQGIVELTGKLRQAGISVIVIGPIAEPGWDVASILSRQLAFGWPVTEKLFEDKAAFDSRYANMWAMLGARADITLIRPDEIQCRQNRCDFLIEGRSLFADSNHIAKGQLKHFQSGFERGYASRRIEKPVN